MEMLASTDQEIGAVNRESNAITQILGYVTILESSDSSAEWVPKIVARRTFGKTTFLVLPDIFPACPSPHP